MITVADEETDTSAFNILDDDVARSDDVNCNELDKLLAFSASITNSAFLYR